MLQGLRCKFEPEIRLACEAHAARCVGQRCQARWQTQLRRLSQQARGRMAQNHSFLYVLRCNVRVHACTSRQIAPPRCFPSLRHLVSAHEDGSDTTHAVASLAPALSHRVATPLYALHRR